MNRIKHITATVFVCCFLTQFGAVQNVSAQEHLAREAKTFGILHKKKLKAYEKVAANTAPYNTDAYPDFSSNVALTFSFDGSKRMEAVASGVLIAPDWVLTVGHNFFDAQEDSSVVPAKGVFVSTGHKIGKSVKRYAVSRIVLQPAWKEGQQGLYDGNDMCLLQLAEPITEITPATIYKDDQEPLGNVVWMSGYGDYTILDNNMGLGFSDRHAIQNILDRKTESTLTAKDGETYTTGLLATDFDHPKGKGNALGDGNTDPKYIEVLGKGDSADNPTEFEGTSVPGDSGGPLYIQKDGSWQVCGLLSLTNSKDFEAGESNPYLNYDYGSVTMYTRISRHLGWIASVMSSKENTEEQ